jgi:phosphatidylserine/phosphatidylglycerophosphate/cardiolipin synthase-like enzyme
MFPTNLTRRAFVKASATAISAVPLLGASNRAMASDEDQLRPVCKFNRPGRDDDRTIADFLISLLRAATDGSQVFAAFYIWDDAEFTQQLFDACNNRLTFRGVVPPDSPNRNQLESVPNSDVRFFGGGRPNHNKFLLLESVQWSRVDRSHGSLITPVLAVGSANVGENEKHNAFVAVPLSTSHYRSLSQYFDHMYAACPPSNAPVPNQYDPLTRKDIYKIYQFPRVDVPRNKELDTLYSVFSNLQSGKGGTVRIVTPRWHTDEKGSRTDRGRLADILVQRIDQATRAGEQLKVQIITRNGKYRGVQELFKGVYDVLKDKAEFRFQDDVKIHSKYFLIDGKYEDEVQRLVWSGTANITPEALTKWETLVKLYDQRSFNAYTSNFEDLWKNATVPDNGLA